MTSTRLKPALRRPLVDLGAELWILTVCGFAVLLQVKVIAVGLWFFIGLAGGDYMYEYYESYQIQDFFRKNYKFYHLLTDFAA